MRSEQNCEDLVNQTKQFSIDKNLEGRDFKTLRLRKKKILAGE